jgi:hypothetical protein
MVGQFLKKFPAFYETRNVFSCSQEHASGPLGAQDESSTHTYILFSPRSVLILSCVHISKNILCDCYMSRPSHPS